MTLVSNIAVVCAQPGTDADTEMQASTRAHAFDFRMKLPYPAGASYTVIQGIGGAFSHSGLSFFAWDFAMPVGAQVCAVAEGMVVCVRQNSIESGLTPEMRRKANMVLIDHGNGVFTQYTHLKAYSVKVREGEIVRGGQVIALSGNTGYSTRPHLHFQVQNGSGESLRAAFLDVPGDGIPKEGRSYLSANDGRAVTKFSRPSSFSLDAFAANGILLSATDLPAKILRLGTVYTLQGTAPGTRSEVVLFVLPESGGSPLLETRAKVRNGEFRIQFLLDGLRARCADWSSDLTQSNVFNLAIVPVAEDGTYWSDISYPICVR